MAEGGKIDDITEEANAESAESSNMKWPQIKEQIDRLDLRGVALTEEDVTKPGLPQAPSHNRIGIAPSYPMSSSRHVASAESTEDLSNSDFCRICHEADQEEVLISPCRCKGSLSLVHRSCLERWLAEADSSTCELCGYIYHTKRFPKYKLLPSVWAWLRSNDTRRERRELGFDILAFCAFTPLAFIGTFLGIQMAETLYTNELDEKGSDWQLLTSITSRIATLSVVSLMCTLDLAYASWIALRLQYHTAQWYSWYRRNCKVRILLDTQARQSRAS